jgi:hypothetical protein
MMEKLAQAGEGAGMQAHPLSLYLPSRTAERADTLTLSISITAINSGSPKVELRFCPWFILF